MPDMVARRRHWHAALDGGSADVADDVAARYRMTGGNIRRVAKMAVAAAAMDGRDTIAPADVREASRALRTRALEPLATLVTTGGGWDELVVHDDTRHELLLLEQRCRSRERLVGVLPGAVSLGSAGVRALFTGPSGAGKTLAARLLGSALELDVYSIEVGRLVDKYLGETEKNLTAVFSRAAELDALLLVDEGDSLMASRTDVRNSNDRYANLQTNHLLQQLEAHEGIVVITTNAADRIDSAFLRRIDVVLEFRAPDALQRWEIWRRHLPPDHEADDRVLEEIATRCNLMGGQIRNAVLHAWLLALEDGSGGGVPGTRHVEAAVRREYRKIGATCPLPAEDWPA
jgi:SpoVK/Ycf46/Vps4 family AAA+-type ATPase